MQVPFAMLFAHTSPSFQDSVKQALIPHLLRHLNQLRGPDAPRGEFYLHAEVFAAMVSIGVVPLKVGRELLYSVLMVGKHSNEMTATVPHRLDVHRAPTPPSRGL
jgi:hypothetical protein